MKIVESKLLTGVSDVVDSASEGNGLTSKLLSWGDLPTVPLDICRYRQGRVELVGVWFGILGLPKLLDVSGPEFIILLYGHMYRVSTNFEYARSSHNTLGLKASSSSAALAGSLVFCWGGAFAAVSTFLASFSRCFWRRFNSLCRISWGGR